MRYWPSRNTDAEKTTALFMFEKTPTPIKMITAVRRRNRLSWFENFLFLKSKVAHQSRIFSASSIISLLLRHILRYISNVNLLLLNELLEQNMFKRLNNWYHILPVFTYNGKDKRKNQDNVKTLTWLYVVKLRKQCVSRLIV